MSGCASGPTHDYYNPAVSNPPKFKGDVTIEVVDDLAAAEKRCLDKGYTVIGKSMYAGDQPTAAELKAQAKRVHSTHVIYSLQPSGPGNIQMHVRFFGGSIGGGYEVSIIFLGK